MSVDDNVYKAKLAEQAERYTEMAEFMKGVCEQRKKELSVEERNLVSVAYKNVVGARRAAWRVLNAIEKRHQDSGEDEDAKLVAEYRTQIEGEMDTVCDEVIDVINNHLVENAQTAEGKVFYHKMAGDYFRYMCEYKTDSDRTAASQQASDCYKKATDIAQGKGAGCEGDTLSSTHPIRLGLALNYSVFFYEIINKPDSACEIAKQAFDDAIAELDSLPEDSYKDATLIMQLLRDNLTLWTTTDDDDEGKD